MLSLSWQQCRVATASVLATVFAFQPSLPAQTHVVSPTELQKAAAAATSMRNHNLKTVAEFLSSPRAEKALGAAQLDLTQVKTAVSVLSDSELAQLASRADRVQVDFAAGVLTDRDLLLIILGMAALVLIIVAVR